MSDHPARSYATASQMYTEMLAASMASPRTSRSSQTVSTSWVRDHRDTLTMHENSAHTYVKAGRRGHHPVEVVGHHRPHPVPCGDHPGPGATTSQTRTEGWPHRRGHRPLSSGHRPCLVPGRTNPRYSTTPQLRKHIPAFVAASMRPSPYTRTFCPTTSGSCRPPRHAHYLRHKSSQAHTCMPVAR